MIRSAGLMTFHCHNDAADTSSTTEQTKVLECLQHSHQLEPDGLANFEIVYFQRTAHDLIWETSFGQSIVSITDKQAQEFRRDFIKATLAALIEDLNRLTTILVCNLYVFVI